MHLLTTLLLLLVVSRSAARLMRMMGQQEIVGEILAGILLGPAIFHLIVPNESLKGITELAIFLVILSAGLEMNFKDVFRAAKGRSLIITIMAFFTPLGVSFFIGEFLQLSLPATLSMGLCLSITALPVSIRILESFKMLDTDFGHSAMGVVILTDILALLALGVILDAPERASMDTIVTSVLSNGGKMVGFFILVLLLNGWFRWGHVRTLRTRRIFDWLIDKLGEEALFGVTVLFVLVFSSITENMGFHFVIGAFFGGLLLNRDIIGMDSFKKLQHTLDSVSSGFLTPLFFAYIGLQFSTTAFKNPTLIALILGMGFLAKSGGAWIGAKLSGFSTSDSNKMGILLNSRGVMDLVVAEIAFERGYISEEVFSALILLGILSTIIVPLLYKKVLGREPVAVPGKTNLNPGS